MSTQKFIFAQKNLQIERTSHVEGKVIIVEEYVAKVKQPDDSVKEVPGFAFHVEGVPYPLRVLKGSVTGGTKAGHFIGCTVKFTGISEEYKGVTYFRPKDCIVTEQSKTAEIFAGDGKFYV